MHVKRETVSGLFTASVQHPVSNRLSALRRQAFKSDIPFDLMGWSPLPPKPRWLAYEHCLISGGNKLTPPIAQAITTVGRYRDSLLSDTDLLSEPWGRWEKHTTKSAEIVAWFVTFLTEWLPSGAGECPYN